MKKIIVLVLIVAAAVAFVILSKKETARPVVTRLEKIPASAVKMTPATDQSPPILHSNEFRPPIPLPGPINTAGAEDSPFIPADGNEFYFFFTPDVKVPVEKQILDGVTGIWMSKKEGSGWGEPERVWLQDPGKLSGDGCEFVQGETIWFCSVREGYAGVHWFTAEKRNGKWSDWRNADFDPKDEVGELAFSTGGNEVYFGSKRPGGKGGSDLWMMRRTDGKWGEPEHLAIVSSPDDEMMPYLTPDGNELWFNRTYRGTPAVFRSRRADGQWQKPEMIVSQFAGEPTVDGDGNVYFIHHYYRNGVMLEADIYVAYKR